MYIKLSDSAIQDKPTVDKPDLTMMKKAYELFLYGFRDEEIVGFGQHFAGTNFKYTTYLDFKTNIDYYIKWQASSDEPNACFLANPIQDNYDQPAKKQTYKKTKVSTITSPTSKETDFVRVHWFFLDLDRKDELKKDKEKKHIPATPEDLNMLFHANQSLMEFLEGLGFTSILNHFSGNGYGLAIPVHFGDSKKAKVKFTTMIALIQDCLKDYPLLELDTQFKTPRQPWSVAGSLNKKGPVPKLRKALNYDKFKREDIAGSRELNSMLFDSLLEEHRAKASPTKEYTPTKKESDPILKGYIKQWNDDHDFRKEAGRQMFFDHGYKLVRDLGQRAFMQRPDKEGTGHGLIVGGTDNLCYSFTPNDPCLPNGKGINPSWAWLLLNRIIDQNGNKLDLLGWDNFWAGIRKTYEPTFSINNQVRSNISKPPAALEPAKPIEQPPAALEPRQATGTLADIPLPGIIEQYAQEIMASNPKHSPSIDRTWALSLWSFIIGKSRAYKTGLLCNSYIVNLAPSSAGKEAGKAFLHKYLEFVADKNEKENKVKGLEVGACCYGYKLLGSSSTSQGLSDEALNHGRIMITGDETERFLHPEENNRIALEVRQTLLEASNSGLIPGRALAQDGTKKTANNCFVSMIHTIQPRAYFEAFQNNQDTKGFIGRLIHFEANKGIVKHHQDINPSNFSEDLIKAGMYWQAENLKGLEHELSNITDKGQNRPSLGRFKPERPIISASKSLQDKIYEYTLYCDELATKEMEANNGLMERFWDKNPEHCIRLAMDFTLAEDWKTLDLSLSSWDLATRIMGLSRQVLIKNQSHILKSKMSQLEEDLMAYLQTFWKAGQTAPLSELWRKFRSRFGENNYKQFSEMINSLQALGMICVDPQEDKRYSQRLSKPIE